MAEVNQVILFHAETTFASFLIPSMRYGLIDSSVNKSTFTPRNSDSSLSILTRVSRLLFSENSTRISMSLSGFSSPLAQEPKTAIFFAPSFSRNEEIFSKKSLCRAAFSMSVYFLCDHLKVSLE